MAEPLRTDALVIGAGPAGLMAAEMLSAAGHAVLVAEAMPTPARKLLMAGKSGLNITKDEPPERFLAAYGEGAGRLTPMLAEFGPAEVQDWMRGLGREVFAGSTGRVFPKEMKASPLLRAWLGRLAERGVRLETRWTAGVTTSPLFEASSFIAARAGICGASRFSSLAFPSSSVFSRFASDTVMPPDLAFQS